MLPNYDNCGGGSRWQQVSGAIVRNASLVRATQAVRRQGYDDDGSGLQRQVMID